MTEFASRCHCLYVGLSDDSTQLNVIWMQHTWASFSACICVHLCVSNSGYRKSPNKRPRRLFIQ